MPNSLTERAIIIFLCGFLFSLSGVAANAQEYVTDWDLSARAKARLLLEKVAGENEWTQYVFSCRAPGSKLNARLYGYDDDFGFMGPINPNAIDWLFPKHIKSTWKTEVGCDAQCRQDTKDQNFSTPVRFWHTQMSKKSMKSLIGEHEKVVFLNTREDNDHSQERKNKEEFRKFARSCGL